MKLFLYLLLFSLLTISTQAQKEANIWYFGQNAGIDFNSGSPVALTDGMLFTDEGCASICDNLGALLFYTDGILVYNKLHAIMPNGSGLMGHNSSTQSAIIIPKPASINKYYIFTTDYEGQPNGLRYSEVDMLLDGGKGDVTTVKNILLKTPISEKITAVRHQNGIDIWVITSDFFTNILYAFLVTNTGVSTIPISSFAGRIPAYGGVGYLKSTSGGSLLAQVHSNSTSNDIDILKFDNITGLVTNFVSINPFFFGSDVPYGLEFSPEGNRLYLSFGGDNREILQYDLSSGVPATIISTSVIIGTASGPASGIKSNGSLQLGPDKKIYLSKYNDTFLSCIPNPNGLGLTCGFINNAVNLSGRKGSSGLPNFIPSLIVNPNYISYTNTCTGIPTIFSIPDVALTGVVWNFGDPASGTNNTSTTFTTSHTYTATGSYTITALTTVPSGTAISTTIVDIISPPIFNLGFDTMLCQLSSITLSVSNTYTNYVWQNGSTLNSQLINSAGNYWLSVTNQCGNITDTIHIIPLTKPVSNIPDTVICIPDGKVFISVANTNIGSQTYLWQNGSTGNSFEMTQAGLYFVDITNRCGITRDSILIESKNCDIIIPNIITANGDNVNDIFTINGLVLGTGSLTIINRWGLLVYESDGYNNDWKPTNLSDGTYFYILKYPIDNKTHKGFITILNK